MICASCGGTIHVNQACEDCGIKYMEMLNGIQHHEMKRLFKKIEEIQKHHGNIDMEASLMACELANASLILPAQIDDNSMGIVELPGPKNKKFIALATDMDEFNKGFEDLTPLTNPWNIILDLLHDDVEGFVINPFDEVVFLGRSFLNPFFEV
jgi:hypothetical protein